LIRRDGRVIWVYDESMVSIDNDGHKLVQGFLLDITARKMVEEQLNRRLAELQAVHGVSETLVRKTDLQKLIVETGDQIRKTFKANNVLIAIHDPSTNLIHFPYDYEDGKLRKDKPIRYGEGMTTQIMEMKRPLIIAENWRGVSAQYNAIYTNINPIKSSFSVPIMTDESVIGVITLESSEQEHAFTENDVLLLSTISSNLAVAIEKTYLQDSLKRELEIQEKLVKELESKNQELEHFTYTASHDLKSPLITIRGFLGYLEKDAHAGNFERLEKDIQRISDATEKMHRLLSELLELSRVGKPMNEKKNVSFQSLVMKALQQVEGQIMERQVAIKVGSDFPSVYVDEERMIEALQNLFDNALKFMGDQPKAEIEINHLSQDNTIVYFIKDNGIGIKKEFQERVFGLFDKLNTNSPGTGIGLAIVRRIIEMHGGKIWIESDGSSGTTFFFTLPETN
ncbi:MAG TPA: ATP-binding protein, partial [Anaerolineales bacterium]|nr:ATP-binding protein [Anaerolineales bacterium]